MRPKVLGYMNLQIAIYDLQIENKKLTPRHTDCKLIPGNGYFIPPAVISGIQSCLSKKHTAYSGIVEPDADILLRAETYNHGAGGGIGAVPANV